MTAVYLLGGGWDERARRSLYSQFAADVLARGGRLAYILQNGTPGRRFLDVFQEVGLRDVRRITISPQHAVGPESLMGVDGLFVAGGSNPLYQRAVMGVAGQIRSLVLDGGMPYAGFSAGSVVAARVALVGGWLTRHGDALVPVCAKRRNEGEDLVAVADGIGLVPFSVDVHGTQWGTLSRAVHAVGACLVDDCVLIDENTVLSIRDGAAHVAGAGSVYRVRREGETIQIRAHLPGEHFAVLELSGGTAGPRRSE